MTSNDTKTMVNSVPAPDAPDFAPPDIAPPDIAPDENGDKNGVPPAKKLHGLKYLWQFLSPYKSRLFGAMIALTVAATATLGIGQAIRRLVDMGFSAANGAFINQYFLGLMGVVTVLAMATFSRYYLVSWLGERVVADIRASVYAHVISLSPAFFDTTRSGEIVSRLTTDTTLIQSAVGSTASVALRNLLMLLGGLVLLAITSPKLTGLVLIVVPVVVLPIIIFGRRVRKLSRSAQDRVAEVGTMAGESLAAVQTVQAYTHEKIDGRHFANAAEQAFKVAVNRIGARAWLTAIVILLVFGAIDLILWDGARDVIIGKMTGGQLAAFVFYAILVAGAVGALSEVYGDLQQAAGASSRIRELLDTRSLIRSPQNPKALALPLKGRVEFDHVTFNYPSRPSISALHDFSLTVEPGETVALVGPSGAGKSTVLQLLLRFYDPKSGQVRLDGVAIDELDPLALRSVMAIVPQDTVIFAASALENIRYGRPDASDAEVRAALKAAAAEDFTDALPEGLNTYLGERGTRLSGGQKQRLAIARAILRDAPVLLLDEATSALDAESEKLVQTALDRLMQGRTTLVIAHRLATVLKADRIVVMDGGKVNAIGTHAELLAEGGIYTRLAELQFGSEKA
jgi:ATP-binding cassette subfamily B protein